MRLIRTLLTLAAIALGTAIAGADPLQNSGRFGVDMRAGPGLQFPLIHVLDPGEVADRGRCDLEGQWCLLTARDKVGWVDTYRLAPPGSALARSDPSRPLSTATIESTPLETPSRPLPGSILDAVNGARDGGRARGPVPPVVVPGARLPRLLSVSEPFRNVTNGEVNLRAGPGTDTAIVGRLRPGEGGVLDLCDSLERWCRIDVPGTGPAWVKMTLMGLRRL